MNGATIRLSGTFYVVEGKMKDKEESHAAALQYERVRFDSQRTPFIVAVCRPFQDCQWRVVLQALYDHGGADLRCYGGWI